MNKKIHEGCGGEYQWIGGFDNRIVNGNSTPFYWHICLNCGHRTEFERVYHPQYNIDPEKAKL